MNKTLLPKVYTPADYEEDIFYKWENSGFFNPNNLPGDRKKAFSICLPPPNVTGQLHIGHAAMLAYQDIMIRYHRLKGDKTLWLPGMDHAAIATQSVVEKQLNKEGVTRYDLGRRKFLERVDQFAAKSKATIRNQIKAMGASLDWSREKFTLDENLSKTVRHVFKKMYDDGLIYRGDRVVNWCPKCQSTLSDDEVEYKEAKGQLYYIKYGSLTIATTRPETKLGDTGVAVNPKDVKYKGLVGQALNIDLAGHKIKVKVFADRAVDINFGTGAIGVTPAHSQQDFLWAEEYNLPLIKIIDEQGKMTDKAGKYQGLSAPECRNQFVSDLEKAGLIEKIEDYNNNLSVCYRCGTVIEPLTSLQWFIDVNKKIPQRGKSLKQLSSEIVKDGDIKIIPDRFNKTYFQWMDNLRDWCISRQIWYGHRIPVWYHKSQPDKEMGFYYDVVPQIFAGKTKTYRLKDRGYKLGDEVAFKNSQMNNIFGFGKIVKVTKTTIGKISLNDPAHGTTYERREDLIAAFKRHYPEIKIAEDTAAYIYEYKFTPNKIQNNGQIKTKITYFVHGTTTDNEKGLASGWADAVLSELGKKQSLELKEKIKNQRFDAVFCSDLKRAVDSAKIVFGDKYEIIKDERLRECNYGDLAQKSEKYFLEKEEYYIENTFSQGESFRDVGKRVSEFLLEIAQKYAGKRIAIVAHKYPQLALEVLLNGKQWPQAIKEDWRKKKAWQPGWNYILATSADKEEFIVPKNITELVLMRHGITDWNKDNRLQGKTDVPLDESSIEEIKRLIPRLKTEQFDVIISSALMRARQTAEIINQELNLPLETSELLIERDYGSFEGKKNQEIQQEYPQYKKDKINYDIPGEGEESYQELAKRVEKFIEETDKKYANKKILVICHNAVMRTFKMVIDESLTEDLTEYKPELGELAVYQILDGQYKLKNYEQDPDTLDTWFSSALWTFSTLGWPASVKTTAGRPFKTGDLKNFHPTSVMETGYDILFFWVARMIMMSTYLLKEKPFETVYLHGLVRTKTGEKMSKSKPETCIDPLAMIKKYGTDALRLSMIVGASPGNDVRLYEEKIAGYRNFVNKLWNISRYILFSVKEVKRYTIHDTRYTTLADRWILAELHLIINSTTKNIEEFNFSRAGEDLYEFTWNKLADWYLEIAKIEGDKDAILLHILEKLLILWHPFCPYATEVLWEEFKTLELLMVQEWPRVEDQRLKTEARINKEFVIIKEIIMAIRNVRAENKIDSKKIYNCSVRSKNQKLIEENKKIIEGLVKVKITPKCPGLSIELSHSEIILDITQNKELKKNNEKEAVNLKRYIEIQENKLNNKNFISKAPKEVINKEKEKLTEAREKLGRLLN